MKIVGIDLSLTSTGVATYHGEPPYAELDCRTIAPKTTGYERVAEICADLWSAALTSNSIFAPLVVIEGYAFAAKGRGMTGLAELRGVLLYTFQCRGTPLVTIPPACLKKYGTGTGNAAKEAVLLAAERRYGHLVEVHNNDEADALMLVAMAMHYYGRPLAPVPALNAKALTDRHLDRWPDFPHPRLAGGVRAA